MSVTFSAGLHADDDAFSCPVQSIAGSWGLSGTWDPPPQLFSDRGFECSAGCIFFPSLFHLKSTTFFVIALSSFLSEDEWES